MESRSQFETAAAVQYMASLCKHFGHRVPTQTDGETGRIEFPFGQCDLEADEISLTLKASAETPDDLDKTVEVITNHLERFAFRENPRIEWQHAPASDVA